jgi:hypothetical protein
MNNGVRKTPGFGINIGDRYGSVVGACSFVCGNYLDVYLRKEMV